MKKSMFIAMIANASALAAAQYYGQGAFDTQTYNGGPGESQGCAGRTITEGSGQSYYSGQTYSGQGGSQGCSGMNYTPNQGASCSNTTQRGCAGRVQGGGSAGCAANGSAYPTSEGGQSCSNVIQRGCAGRSADESGNYYRSAPGYAPGYSANSSFYPASNIQTGQTYYYQDSSRPNTARGQYYYTQQDSSQNGGSDQLQGASDQDRQLYKDIKDALSSGWFSKGYDNVTVRVSNGFVTLNGTVASQDEKTKIEDKIRGLSGVRSINNQLVISNNKNNSSYNNNSNYNNNGSSYNNNGYNQNRTSNGYYNTTKTNSNYPQDFGATQSDKALNAKIRDKISEGWFARKYEEVILKTNNGIVSVEGFVVESNDIPKIVDEIRKVDGVRSVKNNLSTKSE